jgi:hypothetical protein
MRLNSLSMSSIIALPPGLVGSSTLKLWMSLLARAVVALAAVPVLAWPVLASAAPAWAPD